ncbi:zinc metalloprotease [Coemansia erecta]|uniref:CAAX prenyl protease 1 homolog n=1 Tax=Coemansia erecta TaxID=147472 RepID=A0A9W7XXB3_9FUNG|nr:zinc metalloprotease [Coemansia erecta]
MTSADTAAATATTRGRGDSSSNSARFGDDPDSVIDAQAALIRRKGLLDDVIDGIQVGIIVVLFIGILLAAIFADSLPTIFPATKPFYDAFVAIPSFVRSLPEYVLAAWDQVPMSVDEGRALVGLFSQWFNEILQTLPYKKCVIVFSFATYLWEAKLDLRQRNRLREVRRPAAIESFIPRQAYLEANAYGLDKSSLALVRNAFMQVQTYVIIDRDLVPLLWEFTGDVMETYLGLAADQEIIRSVLFFVATTLISTVLTLPFDLYSTFVVEKKHGFNKQTFGLYVSDTIKSLLLTFVFGGGIMAALLWVILKTGSAFVLYAWGLMASVQLLAIVIYPTFIQPLFNKFDPLPEGELRTEIEALASRLNFPLKKLYVVDGSKRSGHSNAYVFGFFKSKRIVIYDTLINQCTTEEIVAIVGHELGHWKKNHILRTLLAVQLQVLVIFYSFGLFVGERRMYTSFGMDETPVFIGLVFFQYLYQPLDSLLSFGTNVLSRKHEFEADAFSKKLGYAEKLRSGLIKLQIENKSVMNPDPLYSAFHYSHPPLVERLNAIDDPEVAPKTD